MVAAQPLSTLPVKPEHLAVIKNALVGVSKEGTSAAAFVKSAYVSAGKTGTAQLYSLKGEKYTASQVDERLRDHAWYIAYAPADKPADRAGRAGRERRLRRAGGGADGAAGVRLLSSPAKRRRDRRRRCPVPETEDQSD